MSEQQLTGIGRREDIGANWHEVGCSSGWVRKYVSRYRCEVSTSSTSGGNRPSRWRGRRRDRRTRLRFRRSRPVFLTVATRLQGRPGPREKPPREVAG